ncbi:hypothetical protein JCM10213_003426 [Rhodosporidiobolus nylandii]
MARTKAPSNASSSPAKSSGIDHLAAWRDFSSKERERLKASDPKMRGKRLRTQVTANWRRHQKELADKGEAPRAGGKKAAAPSSDD